MVSVEVVPDEETKSTPPPPSPSAERLLDAEEIEKLVPQLKRPTAKMQVESLIKKLKQDASALDSSTESKMDVEKTAAMDVEKPAAKDLPPIPAPDLKNIPAPKMSPSVMYHNIDRFSFDAGGYDDKFVSLYLPLKGVGSVEDRKEQIKCDFTKDGFDLIVMKLDGKNYRVKKTSLEHDIDPEKSKYIVKADKIVVKLAKCKKEYGSYDYWTKLTDPNRTEKKKADENKDPSASIMNMMKDMYDKGDDKMKKMIGETMMKQRNGELNKDSMKNDYGDLGNMDD